MVSDSWTDALHASVGVSISLCTDMPIGSNTIDFEFTAPRFTIYRAICERFDRIDRMLDVTKCLLQMRNELAEEIAVHSEQAEWVVGKWSLCCR